MIRSCKFGPERTSPGALVSKGILPHTLSESEVAFSTALTSDLGLQKLLAWGNNTVARKSICEILLHLAFHDSEVSKRFLDWLMQRMGNPETIDLQVCLMAVEALILLPDPFQSERTALFVGYFAKVCSGKITESYLAFSYATDLFIKLALRSEIIRRKIQSEPDKFAFLGTWLKRHAYPAEGEVLLRVRSFRSTGRRPRPEPLT